jgi:hypothetical protein
MNILKSMRTFAIIALLGIVGATPALADKGGHGHSKEHHHSKKNGHSKHDEDHDSSPDVVINIGTSDRGIIQHYLSDNYRPNCPPGLAKKHNGCLPPGQAKKLYHIGRPLPETVVWEPVPQDLLVQLQPVPVGYQYVHVDKDVLLIASASHKVVDAITLLSAVGN